MTSEIFLSWFNVFIHHVQERPLLLILDGHKSHISLSLIEKARQNSVTIVKLPSHTTDKLQPLDCVPFAALKRNWNEMLVDHQRREGFKNISKSQFVDLLCIAWSKAMTPEIIMTGFRVTGIFPLDVNRFPKDNFNKERLSSFLDLNQAQSTSLSIVKTHSAVISHPQNIELTTDMISPSPCQEEQSPKEILQLTVKYFAKGMKALDRLTALLPATPSTSSFKTTSNTTSTTTSESLTLAEVRKWTIKIRKLFTFSQLFFILDLSIEVSK